MSSLSNGEEKMRKACYLCVCASFSNIFSSSCEMCVFSLDISQKKEKRGERESKKSFRNERTIRWGWKLMWYSIFLLCAFFSFHMKTSSRVERKTFETRTFVIVVGRTLAFLCSWNWILFTIFCFYSFTIQPPFHQNVHKCIIVHN